MPGIVAYLMDQQTGSADVTPKVIISTETTFTGQVSTATTGVSCDGHNIKTIPWVNVMGNHDYGDADSDSGDGPAASESDELVTAVKNKFSRQSTYTTRARMTIAGFWRTISMSTPLRTQILV
ncbi:hypothetical protein PI125_g18710 [Phytophthora idaei]|nr:hypothetical protein PI125_g18710 [Phytophthora idaei]KAG3137692.1 hypothetical protein PI126_g17262 [Phytophthora idaei]